MGWQGDAVDVEIERCDTATASWLWTVYDRRTVVTSGVARSHRRAHWAGWWATFRYRVKRRFA